MNFKRRIIMTNTKGRLRRIRRGNEIIDLNIIAERLKTMCEALRNV